MNNFSLLSLNPVASEIFLALAGMALLIAGAFMGGRSLRLISWASVAAYAVAGLMILGADAGRVETFGGLFVMDSFGGLTKIFLLFGLIATTVLSIQYLHQEQMLRFEYPVLVLFSGVGMMLMVSAHDMLSLYVALELQSLSLYVLAAIRRDHLRSAESGMKYFILGAISSGFLLFGISLMYGYTGTTNFTLMGQALSAEVTLGAVIGMVFILAGIAFKVSAVPFHMWTPDVYEGAPTSVTAFFAMVPKLAALALIIRLVFEPFAALSSDWGQIMWFLAAASMVVGAFAGLRQGNIKRLLAYSSIGNMGYALMGVVAASAMGVGSLLFYMAIYMVMTAGTFAVILSMRRNGQALEQMSDLSGLSQNSPVLAYILALLMFSMSGIPPLAGFFGKFAVFQAAMDAHLYVLAVIGVLTSVVSAFYYLRIIKIMFFDAPSERYDDVMSKGRQAVLALSFAFIALFIFSPSGLLDVCRGVAASVVAVETPAAP
jgi:NADH-quinone oxidoreductase subunit N